MTTSRRAALSLLLGASVWAVALSVCLDPALFGHQRWNFGAVAGLVGPAVTLWGESSDVWLLSAADRARLRSAVATGNPTWDLRLDRIVADRLRRAATRSRTSLFVVGAVSTLLTVGAAVLAAFRADDARYLVCIVAVLFPLVWFGRFLVGEDPQRRLARFDAALDGDSACVVVGGDESS